MSGGEAPNQRISVVYDASDFRALFWACGQCRKTQLWIAAVPLLGLIFEIADGARGIRLLYLAIPYAFIGFVILLSFYFLAPTVQIRSRRKNGWGVPMEVQLSEDSVVTRHPSQDSRFHWAAIKDVVANDDRLFLFTTSNCAIILPRRVFDDDAQFADWASRARHYWREARGAEAE